MWGLVGFAGLGRHLYGCKATVDMFGLIDDFVRNAGATHRAGP